MIFDKIRAKSQSSIIIVNASRDNEFEKQNIKNTLSCSYSDIPVTTCKFSLNNISCFDLALYEVVQKNALSMPAILHKCRERKNIYWDIFSLAASWAQMGAMGAVYTPKQHTWSTNAAWLLSHIHKQSQFFLISNLGRDNLRREKYPDRWSALAREVAIIMIAGYVVVDIKFQGFVPGVLLASTKSKDEAIKFSLAQCKADNNDCDLGISKFFDSLALFLAVSTQLGKYFDSKLMEFITGFLNVSASSQHLNMKLTKVNEAKIQNNISFFKSKLVVSEQFIPQELSSQSPSMYKF